MSQTPMMEQRSSQPIPGAPSLLERFRRLRSDRRGVAAVEFAFIAPILLCMYFMTMEVSQAIETNKKIGRSGSTVADLITQQASIPQTEVDAIMQIGDSLVQPYNRSRPTIEVTAIRISNETTPKVTVDWSRKMVNGNFSAGAAKNSVTTVPDSLKIPGTFLIRVEAKLNYKPVIVYGAQQKSALGLGAAFDSISMNEQYYLRPRMSPDIPCTGC